MRAGLPREREAHQHGPSSASPRPSCRYPSRVVVVEGAGGAGRRREGARAERRTSCPCRGGPVRLATSGPIRRERGDRRVAAWRWSRWLRNHLAGGSRDLGPGVEARVSLRERDGRASGAVRCPGPAWPGSHARDRTQDRSGGSSGEDQRPREHRPFVPRPARTGSDGNGLPGGVKLRSGRDGRVNRRVTACEGSVGRAEPEQLRLVRSQRPRESTLTATQSSGGLRSSSGNWSGRVWKAVVKLPSASRRRWSTTNPQGSNGPRERVRLPGKGKLCRAAPRDASGTKEGREASGASRRAAGLARVRACRERSQIRREGQEPCGRHRRGCGNPRPPWPARVGQWRSSSRRRGTRRSCVRGGKNLRRDGPGSTSGSSPRKRWGATARQPGQT